MLTDEELSTRLSTAFHESIPDLTYAGAVPQVRTRGTGLAATSVLAAAAALALTPATTSVPCDIVVRRSGGMFWGFEVRYLSRRARSGLFLTRNRRGGGEARQQSCEQQDETNRS